MASQQHAGASSATMSRSVGIYRDSKLATRLAHKAAKTVPVAVLGSIYTEGVTPGTLVSFLYDDFDAASLFGRSARGSSPVVVAVDTEKVEPEMIRSLLPHCPPVLFRLPRSIPKMIAAIKAERERARERVLVIVDPLPGPSTTAQLMLLACDTVVFPLDGTRESCSALRLFLHLVPSWLEQYKTILKSHRPHIVIFARDTGTADLASHQLRELRELRCPADAVVQGPVEALLAYLEEGAWLGA